MELHRAESAPAACAVGLFWLKLLLICTCRWGDCVTSGDSCTSTSTRPSSSTCTTSGGPASGRPCVFPFTYNGIKPLWQSLPKWYRATLMSVKLSPNCLFTWRKNLALSQWGFWQFSFCRKFRFIKGLLCWKLEYIYSSKQGLHNIHFLQNLGSQKLVPCLRML